MSRRVTLASIPDVKVTLGAGDDARDFRLAKMTLEVEERLQEASEEIARIRGAGADSGNPDRVALMQALVAQLDILLTPMGGQKRMPSEILLEGYKAGTVTAGQVHRLIDDVVDAGRPT